MTIQLASPVPNPCVEGYGALMFVLAQILSIMGGPQNTLPLLNQGFFQAFLRRPMRRLCLPSGCVCVDSENLCLQYATGESQFTVFD